MHGASAAPGGAAESQVRRRQLLDSRGGHDSCDSRTMQPGHASARERQPPSAHARQSSIIDKVTIVYIGAFPDPA